MKTLTALILASALVAGPVLAAGVTLNDETRAQVTQTLTEQGYEVTRVKTEDGLFEAYARKDGKKMEVFLDADMNIVRIKD